MYGRVRSGNAISSSAVTTRLRSAGVHVARRPRAACRAPSRSRARPEITRRAHHKPTPAAITATTRVVARRRADDRIATSTIATAAPSTPHPTARSASTHRQAPRDTDRARRSPAAASPHAASACASSPRCAARDACRTDDHVDHQQHQRERPEPPAVARVRRDSPSCATGGRGATAPESRLARRDFGLAHQRSPGGRTARMAARTIAGAERRSPPIARVRTVIAVALADHDGAPERDHHGVGVRRNRRRRDPRRRPAAHADAAAALRRTRSSTRRCGSPAGTPERPRPRERALCGGAIGRGPARTVTAGSAAPRRARQVTRVPVGVDRQPSAATCRRASRPPAPADSPRLAGARRPGRSGRRRRAGSRR